MKYSLDVYFVTNNGVFRKAVKDTLPSKDHPSVYNGQDQYVRGEGTKESGDKYFTAMIQFNVKADRDGFASSIDGLIESHTDHQCRDESFVRTLEYYHDETPVKPCKLETILRP